MAIINNETSVDLTYNKFVGKDNLNDPTRLKIGEDAVRLTIATDIFINKDFSMERREGYTLIQSGSFSSMWSQNGKWIVIKDGNLVQITKNGIAYTFTPLIVASGKLVYADTGLGIYFSDGITIKVFRNGVISDVSATTVDFKIQTPAGHILEYHKSRLYIAVGNLIFITDPNNFDIVDGRAGIKPYSSKILMWKALSTGVYMSDSYTTWFLKDMNPDEVLGAKVFGYKKVLDYPAIFGTGKKIYNLITPAQRYFEEAVIWTSEQGICIGGPNGEVENVTEKTYDMPSVVEGTDLYRKTGKNNQYISILKIRG